MLPRKLHLEQINRFHDMLESIDKKLEDETLTDTDKFSLARKYYRLTKLWPKIDDFIEFTLKDKLDDLSSLKTIPLPEITNIPKPPESRFLKEGDEPKPKKNDKG